MMLKRLISITNIGNLIIHFERMEDLNKYKRPTNLMNSICQLEINLAEKSKLKLKFLSQKRIKNLQKLRIIWRQI